MKIRPADLRVVLSRMKLFRQAEEGECEEVAPRSSEKKASKTTVLQMEYDRAATRSQMLWQTEPVDGPLVIEGEMHGERLQEYVKARHQGVDEEEETGPYAGKTAPRAELYSHTSLSPQQWLQSTTQGKRRTNLAEEPKRPNTKQAEVLKRVVERITQEERLEQTDTKRQSEAEPLRDLVHGCPGTGKSCMIGWLRDLFENVLGWEHGVQFVCLSFQNTMAAYINGLTIHHWAGIDPTAHDGSCATKDSSKMSTKCQNLRFIIIDEISMVSAQLFGTLEISAFGLGLKSESSTSHSPFPRTPSTSCPEGRR